MGFLDILQQYAQGSAPAADTHAHFDAVAADAPADDLGRGISEALRQGGSSSFGASVAQMFGNSNPGQRAGILQQLLQAVEPALLGSLAGGALSRFGAAPPTPQDAGAVTPAQAGELAQAAQQRDPGVIDRVGSFYAQHPTVVKALGTAALALVMNHMANRSRQ